MHNKVSLFVVVVAHYKRTHTAVIYPWKQKAIRNFGFNTLAINSQGLWKDWWMVRVRWRWGRMDSHTHTHALIPHIILSLKCTHTYSC